MDITWFNKKIYCSSLIHMQEFLLFPSVKGKEISLKTNLISRANDFHACQKSYYCLTTSNITLWNSDWLWEQQIIDWLYNNKTVIQSHFDGIFTWYNYHIVIQGQCSLSISEISIKFNAVLLKDCMIHHHGLEFCVNIKTKLLNSTYHQWATSI